MNDMPMHLMALPFPTIDPVAIGIGPLEVRWYGLAYLAGLIIGWLYMRALARNGAIWGGQSPITPDKVDDFLIYATIGTIIGGRLGFVVFYEPSYFIENPLEIFVLWGGGMAFHGGLLGVGLATYIFARRNNIPVFSVMDLAAAATPFGLFFGRIANFINGEIYGRLTNVPWAVEFPPRVLEEGHAFGPRHPTQIYEAILEGIVLFIALRYLTHKRGALQRPGIVVGAFLMIYGAVRIFAEFFKEWDYGQFFTTAYWSTGMVYSLPMIALGLYFYLRAAPEGRDRFDQVGVDFGRGLENAVSFAARGISFLGFAIASAMRSARAGFDALLPSGAVSGPRAALANGISTAQDVGARIQTLMRSAPGTANTERRADAAATGRPLAATVGQTLKQSAGKLRLRALLALLWLVNLLIAALERARNGLMVMAHRAPPAKNLLAAPAQDPQDSAARNLPQAQRGAPMAEPGGATPREMAT